MKRGALATLVVTAMLAGCATGEVANPNLAAPKFVLQPRADGNVTVFVHGAFREQSYDWIALHVDNETLVNVTDSFSLEHRVASHGFFLEVVAQAGETSYSSRARVDVNETSERFRVAFLTDDWSDPRAYGWPYEHIMDRQKVDA